MKIFNILVPVLIIIMAGCREIPTEKPVVLLDGISNIRSLETGDLNNDGRMDLAVAVKNRGILIFYGNEKGFAVPADKEIPVAQPQDFKTGDFDGDGKTDLAVADSFKQNFHLFLGKEALSKDHASTDCNQFCGFLEIGKLNKDGKFDFLTGPVWREWMGNDSFKHGFFQYVPGNGNEKAFLADLNKDSANDVIFTTAENKIRIYYGPFPEMKVTQFDVSEFTELSAPAAINDVLSMDFNCDGKPDLVASGKKEDVFIYYQNSPMGFTNKTGPSKTLKTNGPVFIATADYEYSLIIAEKEKGKINILNRKNNRNEILESGIKISYLKISDIDGDKVDEIIAVISNIMPSGKVIMFKYNNK